MGSDKAATSFEETIIRLGAGIPGVAALMKGILAASPPLGHGRKMGDKEWAAAMDQRFPTLLPNDNDDPHTYDDARGEQLPWYQRLARTFGEAYETAEAVRCLNGGFQEMGRRIKDKLGTHASDTDIAAAFQGGVHQSLRAISAKESPLPPTVTMPVQYAYRADEGFCLANQTYWMWKKGQCDVFVREGAVSQPLADGFLAKVRARMESEHELLVASNPDYTLPHILQGCDGYDVPGGPNRSMPDGSNLHSNEASQAMDVDAAGGRTTASNVAVDSTVNHIGEKAVEGDGVATAVPRTPRHEPPVVRTAGAELILVEASQEAHRTRGGEPAARVHREGRSRSPSGSAWCARTAKGRAVPAPRSRSMSPLPLNLGGLAPCYRHDLLSFLQQHR